MAGRLSLPVEDPDEPDRPKGFRGVDEDTLGPGNHLNREGKKMVLLVYEAFRDDIIRVNTKLYCSYKYGPLMPLDFVFLPRSRV